MEQQQISDKQNSISIDKNSKGYTWSIKLYYNEEKTTATDIINQIKQIDSELKAKFEQVI